MALLSLLLSVVHGLLLVLVPILVFLWIIGKLKAIREQNQRPHYQQPFPHHLSTDPEPSPTNIPLQPRRLSFSSAATITNTPTPNPKRRVTFSLTPEQQANELLKTAVRRREALPAANLFIQNHSPTPHYQPKQEHQIAHLFPQPNSPPFQYNPPASRPIIPPSNLRSMHAEQRPNPSLRNPSNLPAPAPATQKRKTSPNTHRNPLPKRQRSPRKPLPRPTSPPPYAVDYVRPSRKRIPQLSNKEITHFQASKTNTGQSEQVVKTERAIRSSPPRRANIRTLDPEQQNHTLGTPSSDKKPPKPPVLTSVPNGFATKKRTQFQQGFVPLDRQNGFVQRALR